MKKFILFFALILIFSILSCAKAYQAYDGKYNYNQYGPQSRVQTYQINPNNSNTEVLFIVDFSSSMRDLMGSYTKAQLASDALISIINNTASQTKMGLRIFGVTDKPLMTQTPNGILFNRNNICTATNLLLPIARYNASNISYKLARINPNGGTPIGYSLRQAVKYDFSNGPQLKHIILITDGGENCGDNPCAFINSLMSMRHDFRVDVIGISVSNNAYSQLSCIAKAGGGNYYSISRPQDFKIKFQQALDSVPHPAQNINASTAVAPPRFTPPIELSNNKIRYKTYGFQFGY